MPLSEFLQKTARAKAAAAATAASTAQPKMSNFSSGMPFSIPDHELAELLWENGQIVTHDHHITRNGKNLPYGHSNHSDRNQGNNGGTFDPKNTQSDAIDPFGNALPDNHDDDIVPWISYPLEEPLRTDFCSDFFEEFAGGSLGLGSVQDLRNSGNAQHEHASKAPIASLEHGRSKPNPLFQSLQQRESSVTNASSRVLELGMGERGKAQIDPGVELVNTRNQNPPSTRPARPNMDTGFVNFSLFSRPLFGARDKVSALMAGSTLDPKFVEPSSVVKHTTAVQGQSASGLSKLSEKPLHRPIVMDQLKATTEQDMPSSETDNILAGDCNVTSNMASTKHQAAKAAVASSSLCSVNDAGVESSEPKGGEKRKSCEREESSSHHSEDLEDESVGAKRSANARRTGSKRSRAAEVHNLSERRRRERINEKMRALQELIPNCNKADKASMLEDAIEYLKSLQQQVQFLLMGSGMYMQSMMLPPGMQHMRASHMSPFSAMGVGMGMGMGMGYRMGMYDLHGPSVCPIVPVSPIQRPPFPCPSVLGPANLHGLVGATNQQMFGAPRLGVPPSSPRLPQVGSSSDLLIRPNSVTEISARTTVPAPSSSVLPPASADHKQESKNLGAA